MLAFVASCTRKNPDYCDADTDCVDGTKPFCDVNGEYPESGYVGHSCSTTPTSCPVERCGCVPGEGLTCAGDQLTYCNADARSTATLQCSLGCAPAEARCLSFNPSNGLADALDQAAMEPDISIPAGATINTGTGEIRDSSGALIAVKSVSVAQPNTTIMIRAFIAKSFVIDSVVVGGPDALALVAPGPITLNGMLDASANSVTAGPGAQEPPAPCVGGVGVVDGGTSCYCYQGAGGAGNASIGGAGGGAYTTQGAPGATLDAFEPLLGGCRGGDFDTNGRYGGGGGGAVQMSSATSITISASAMIHVGAGGGNPGRGGGSGGNVIIEAPLVRVAGPSGGLAANGGAGGGCGNTNGSDALPSLAYATAPLCPPQSAGYGGTISLNPASGMVCTSSCPAIHQYGGGGGAVGRVRIATQEGTFQPTGTPIMSAVVTTQTISTR